VEIGELVAFLKSLTDPAARDLTSLIPARVPSGLPVQEWIPGQRLSDDPFHEPARLERCLRST